MTSSADRPAEEVELFVVGAHLRGQPLDHQLTDLGAAFLGADRTAPAYRLVVLETAPPKPGLVRLAAGGAAITGERWSLSVPGFGAFVAAVPSPLTIGRVLLEDGRLVAGFLCETWAADGAPDISSLGGWLAHLESIEESLPGLRCSGR